MEKINRVDPVSENGEVGNTWACIAVCATACYFTYLTGLHVATAFYLV